eukprot:1141285-Rhodomonas_salina.1
MDAYKGMKRAGIRGNVKTYNMLIGALAESRQWDQAIQVTVLRRCVVRLVLCWGRLGVSRGVKL